MRRWISQQPTAIFRSAERTSIPIYIGLNKAGSVLVLALRSRLPVPNAAKLRELDTGVKWTASALAKKILDRIMIWVYSPAAAGDITWSTREVSRYDLDFPASRNILSFFISGPFNAIHSKLPETAITALYAPGLLPHKLPDIFQKPMMVCQRAPRDARKT